MLNNMTTFAILDDKPEELKRMAHLIKQIPNAAVVRTLRAGEPLLTYLKSTKALPNFILIDIKIGIDYKEGYKIAETVSQKYPNINLILCSEYPDTTYLKDVVAKATAKGFINKESIVNNLQKAITKIIKGGEYWDELPKNSYFRDSNYLLRESKKRLLEEKNYLIDPKEKQKIGNDIEDKEIQAYKSQCDIQLEYDLTVHQWLIFKLLAKGSSGPQIAKLLYTSNDSVNVQKSKIRRLLEINESSDVWFMVKALKLGIVEVREFLEEKAAINIIK